MKSVAGMEENSQQIGLHTSLDIRNYNLQSVDPRIRAWEWVMATYPRRLGVLVLPSGRAAACTRSHRQSFAWNRIAT